MYLVFRMIKSRFRVVLMGLLRGRREVDLQPGGWELLASYTLSHLCPDLCMSAMQPPPITGPRTEELPPRPAAGGQTSTGAAPPLHSRNAGVFCFVLSSIMHLSTQCWEIYFSSTFSVLVMFWAARIVIQSCELEM